ncbi:MAG: D-alanine--D-alanine ligase [Pseudomonadota bacterium]
MSQKTVALFVGGWSAERDVSLKKGRAVEKALKDNGYNVRVIDVTRDVQALIRNLTPRPDVVFNNLHGTGGEDGVIQGLLEILQIPYTHSSVAASAVGMNKPLAKSVAASVGVPSAEGVVVTRAQALSGQVMSPPYVIKPPCEGSSVGVTIIHNLEQQSALAETLTPADTDHVLVERYIPGKELTVAVLDGKAQAVTEIISHTQFFDYEAKYVDTTTEYVMPAQVPAIVTRAAMDYAARVYTALGCTGLARCDFRYDDSQADATGLYFLEINTQPGLTPDSIGPSQVVYNGMSFNDLCAHLVETARCHGGGDASVTTTAEAKAHNPAVAPYAA